MRNERETWKVGGEKDSGTGNERGIREQESEGIPGMMRAGGRTPDERERGR